MSTLKQIDNGKDSEGRKSNIEHHKRSKKKQRTQERRKDQCQLIQNMLLGSIKCEPVSLFSVIFSDVNMDLGNYDDVNKW